MARSIGSCKAIFYPDNYTVNSLLNRTYFLKKKLMSDTNEILWEKAVSKVLFMKAKYVATIFSNQCRSE